MHPTAEKTRIHSLNANWRQWGAGVLLAGVFIFFYAKTFSMLANAWLHNSNYSHGVLVPVISLYLIWLRKEMLLEAGAAPNYLLGLPLTAAGVFMALLGQAGSVAVVQELSIVVSITGLVLLILGTGVLKILWFPIAYLLFMLRFWETFTEGLHLPFQVFSCAVATRLIQAIGVPAFGDYIYIELPNKTLEVARECSGVNYFISVIAIGVPLAYVTLKSWPRRLILAVCVLVTALLANSIRVAFISTLVYYDVSGDLHGPYHMLQAMFVAVLGFFVLFTGAWALSKFPYRKPPDGLPSGPGSTMARPGLKGRRLWPPAVIAAVILAAAGSYTNLYSPPPIPLKKDLKEFPYEIGRWKGSQSAPDFTVYRANGVDHELSRTYSRGDGNAIKLYIGYYERQDQSKELVNYQTAFLHAGSSEAVLPGGHGPLRVNKLMKSERGSNRFILFWYDLNGRIITGRVAAKAYTALDALFKRRTNGAVVIVYKDIPGEQAPPEEALIGDEYGEFIKYLSQTLGDFLP